MTEWIGFEIFIFVIGTCIGSFLNVCIVRLPHEQSVVHPPSHCVSCKKPVAWFDNIPLVSYLVLRGKCRNCGTRYSPRYLFVELLTGVIFWGFFKFYGPSPVLIPYLVMVSCFIVATLVDFKHRIIPDEISIGGMQAGIALSVLFPALHAQEFSSLRIGGIVAGIVVGLCLLMMAVSHFLIKPEPGEDEGHDDDRGIKIFVLGSLLLIGSIEWSVAFIPAGILPYAQSLSASLSGYLVGGGTIYLMGLIGDIIFRKESMGGGDVKLMAMVGAFLGWKLALLTFFLAPFFGAVYGIVEKIRTKDSAIAYGPFLVLGALLSLFYGDVIIAWVLSGYGLR